jgi:hypothetical protein
VGVPGNLLCKGLKFLITDPVHMRRWVLNGPFTSYSSFNLIKYILQLSSTALTYLQEEIRRHSPWVPPLKLTKALDAKLLIQRC